MEQLLTDKTAVVTGGSSGNGRAIARRFAEHGADVVIADIVETPREGGMPTDELIREETDRDAVYVDCDVSNIGDIEEAVDAAEEFGGVDVMVNNAAIFEFDDFPHVDQESFDQFMAVNIRGVFFGSQEAAKRMLADGREGSIINISSRAGLEGVGDYIRYSTSKGAVRLMTYALADRLGKDGIRANVIHPGLTETQMTKEDLPVLGDENEDYEAGIALNRAGKPGEIADAALYLASDLSSFVTAESLVVDGGTTYTG